MSHLSLLLSGMLLLLSPFAAAQTQKEADGDLPVAKWLADFSNLPKKSRAEYISLFQQAKQAYLIGDWAVCYGLLSQCEFIYAHNPHVWNLRAVCLIAQKNYTEAELELNKAKQELPYDETTLMNIANLHMGKGEFKLCIETIRNLMETQTDQHNQALIDILTFRIYLCHLMQGEIQEAKNLVSHLTPLSDTPLYYYSQAALHIAKGNRTQARQDIIAADSIFAKGNFTLPYIRAIQASGLEEKFLQKQ